MVCLGIDTSGETLSVGLSDRGKVLGQRVYQEGDPHSVVLIDEIEAMLEETGVALDEISLIAVSGGPGRYTALRVGMATGKGIAMSKEIPLVRVSTLEALAWSILPAEGTLYVVMDARRKLVYYARFEVRKDKLFRIDVDQALPYPEAAAFVSDGAGVTGDGVSLILPELEKRGISVKILPGLIHGGVVACLGEEIFSRDGRNELFDGPAYIRQVEVHNPNNERR